MEKIKFSELENYFDKEIEVSGFIENIRVLQYVIFIVLKDKYGKLQVTIEKEDENNSKLVEIASNLTLDSTVKIKGILKQNPKVKLNGMELIPSCIEVTSKSLEELPINYKDLANTLIDTRLDNRMLDLRNERNNYIFRIQSDLIRNLRDTLYNKDFMEIHTPKLIGAASESGSEVFEVKYFERLAYLAQSPQFYKQMAMASGFEKIFEVGPVFRAENSNTNRHATEFTSFDVEFSYINSFSDVMDLEEEMITNGLAFIKEKYGDKIKELFNVDVVVPTRPFPRVKLNDLYKELESLYGYKAEGEDLYDLSSEGEKLAARYAMDKYNSEFIFITGYPAEKRAFYHMRDDDGLLNGYDLIWKGTEITTGAQREHRYEVLKRQAEEKGLKEDIKFYLDFFKYGCPPHGGFGLGVDRLTLVLLEIPVKEAMFIFRGPNRLNP
ncbi:MAG: aspartate--tRNA(Asn) ligase [bacterium]|nr:aspartate--tRNA(Asn) ligase [bacterium]